MPAALTVPTARMRWPVAVAARAYPAEGADAQRPDAAGVRRVPGLRREEPAQLAHVSVDYIVRLEQGRTHRVSWPVLEALADARRSPRKNNGDTRRSRCEFDVS
ncbi:helix-turn-helix domain-containing protein [Streptomyces inhibens]|uniref:helix-turn-helix domain-containing protein n=1 Tax=Streptomyces inhibens TaxID=2293571 RepID=UPI0037B82F5B